MSLRIEDPLNADNFLRVEYNATTGAATFYDTDGNQVTVATTSYVLVPNVVNVDSESTNDLLEKVLEELICIREILNH